LLDEFTQSFLELTQYKNVFEQEKQAIKRIFLLLTAKDGKHESSYTLLFSDFCSIFLSGPDKIVNKEVAERPAPVSLLAKSSLPLSALN
jgi:hypothetical protein